MFGRKGSGETLRSLPHEAKKRVFVVMLLALGMSLTECHIAATVSTWSPSISGSRIASDRVVILSLAGAENRPSRSYTACLSMQVCQIPTRLPGEVETASAMRAFSRVPGKQASHNCRSSQTGNSTT